MVFLGSGIGLFEGRGIFGVKNEAGMPGLIRLSPRARESGCL